MNSAPNTNIKKGFFKRVFDYIKIKNYEKKVIERTVYKKDWERIKWKYRAGKLSFLMCFILIGKYFYVSKILDLNKIPNKQIELLKTDFESLLNSENEEDFDQFKNELVNLNKNLFDLKFYDSNEIIEDSKAKLTKDITDFLFDTLNNDYKQHFNILKLIPKTTVEELEEMPLDVQKIFK